MKKKTMRGPKLRLPKGFAKARGRSLAALVAAMGLGAGIGWLGHQPEPPMKEPTPYSATLAPVAPPPQALPKVQPAAPVNPPIAAPVPVPAPRAVVPAPMAVPPSITPAPSPTELPPWRRYAVAAPALDGRIPIAVVIDDVGVDVARSRRAMGLPAAVTLSLLPYGASIDRQAEQARARGHEIIVHVSMEAETRKVDPGPNALTTELAPAEIVRRLDWALSRFPAYVGFNNHMGSRFTSNEPGMRLVLAEAKRRGLLFLDSKTAPETIGRRLSTEFGVPFAARDVFLDNDANAGAVAKQLAALETIARRDHGAIAIGHPHDGTLAALEAWIPTLAANGFVLVPLTALVKAPAVVGRANGGSPIR